MVTRLRGIVDNIRTTVFIEGVGCHSRKLLSRVDHMIMVHLLDVMCPLLW